MRRPLAHSSSQKKIPMDLSTARGAIHNCKQYADYRTIKSKVFPSYFAGHDDKHRCRATALQYAGRGGTCGFYQKGRAIQVQIGTKLDMVPIWPRRALGRERRSKWKSPSGEKGQGSTSTSIRTTTHNFSAPPSTRPTRMIRTTMQTAIPPSSSWSAQSHHPLADSVSKDPARQLRVRRWL